MWPFGSPRQREPGSGISLDVATTAIGIRAARELDELYRVHAAEVYRYVYAVLGHQADAEDVTQTTFVNALRALERGEQPRKPTNWLITIAHNLIRQSFRQQQTRPHEVELDRELASIETDHDGPSLDDLVRALQRIPPSQREALVLRELEGRSYKEIAAILAVSSTALETLIFRARRSLAEEVENLVTCDRAQLALSQQTDGRLGRKERKRLVAHLEECPRCARVAALGIKRRHAFKELALLPLPLSLTLFKGAPSATAAIGVPAIGAGGAAVGSGIAVGGGAAVGSGVATKVAVALVALTVAGGASYEGVRQIRQPATPAKAVPTEVVPTKAVPTKAGAKARPARAGSAKTGAGKPRAAKASVTKPSATKPSATRAGATKPSATRAGATSARGTKASAKKPSAKKPSAKKPSAKRPGAATVASKATKHVRTPIPPGRPTKARSAEAKQPGHNGRDAPAAPSPAKAPGQTKRPPRVRAAAGKSTTAHPRAHPAPRAKPTHTKAKPKPHK